MEIKIVYLQPSGINTKIHTHFLLRDAEVKCVAIDKKSGEYPISASKAKDGSAFAFKLDRVDFSRLEFRFQASVRSGTKQFFIIKIIQIFELKHLPPDNSTDYELLPHTWRFEDLRASLSTSHQHNHPGTHSLLQYDDKKKLITLECTVLDVTDYWLFLRKNNPNYLSLFALMPPPEKIGFRVLANLSGIPFIWHLVFPKALLFQSSVNPHVFFSPADNAEEKRADKSDEDYFYDTQFSDGRTERNSGQLGKVTDGKYLRDYLASPALESKVPTNANFFRYYRNVNKAIPSGSGLVPNFWQIPLGFAKALAESSEKQLLLMPQRHENGGNGLSTTPALNHIVGAAIRLLRSNSETLGQNFNVPFSIGKYIFSAYSDSGNSVWAACQHEVLIANLKGILLIEPMGMGETGTKILGKLLARNVQVHYVGRWRGTTKDIVPAPTSQFAVNLADKKLQSKIHFYPSEANYAKTWSYPPKVNASQPFIKFRNYRFIDLNSDPLMAPLDEKQLIEKLSQDKNAKGEDLLKELFQDKFNNDSSGNYYSHNFAISGGQIFNLPAGAFYGKDNIYKTFFHEAIESLET
ncbi:hypothetical protein QT970_06070 [Microcoleus sp. herbarium8]|uniref:hypothetical protein n=1 Tax=Microcoleus sp. herbarium8 TaxID=3055436 RepID=UPI002FCEE05F